MTSTESPDVPRKQMSAEVRRELLLDAAFRVMRRDGIAAATTRAICAEAGMPHGAFHYCFASKSELYAGLLGRGLNVNLDAAWPDVSPARSVEENSQTLLRALWSLVQQDPDGQLVLFDLGSFALHDPDLQGLSKWEYQTSLDHVISDLDRFASETGIRYLGEPRVLAEMILAQINGVTWSWLAHRDDEIALAAIDGFATLLAGWATPTATAEGNDRPTDDSLADDQEPPRG